MLKMRKETKETKKVKSVPKVAASGKSIALEKKNRKVTDADGNIITMDELLAQHRKGERGKGGGKGR